MYGIVIKCEEHYAEISCNGKILKFYCSPPLSFDYDILKKIWEG